MSLASVPTIPPVALVVRAMDAGAEGDRTRIVGR